MNIDFDFDSFVRAGEVKLCGRMRAGVPHRWGWDCQRVLVLLLCLCILFAARRVGLNWFGRCFGDFSLLFVVKRVGFNVVVIICDS